MTDTTPPFTWEHVLYRFRNADNVLLYVGITDSIRRRFNEHSKQVAWWSDVASCQIEFFPSRQALALAEYLAILNEKPLHNIRTHIEPPRKSREVDARPKLLVSTAGASKPLVPEKWRRRGFSDDEWNWMHYLGTYAGQTNN